jgi:hypothetical protein
MVAVRSGVATLLAVAAVAAVVLLVGVEEENYLETGRLEVGLPFKSLSRSVKGSPPVRSAIRRAVRRENRARDGMVKAQNSLKVATAAAAKVTSLSEVAATKSAVVMQRVQAVVAAVKKKQQQANKKAALAALAQRQVAAQRRAKLRKKVKKDAVNYINLEANKAVATVAEAAATAAVLNVQAEAVAPAALVGTGSKA